MLKTRFIRHLALIGCLLGSSPASICSAASATPDASLAIEDFTYLDTSGEPADQAAAHLLRLKAFMVALRRDVEADGRYHLIPSPCAPPCVKERPADLVHAASAAGAGILIVGGIQKLSTLIQWAKVTAIDVSSNHILYDKRYTFRGDTDEAWEQAEVFVSRDVRAALASTPPAPAAAPAPIKLAVFDFELEDASAAASATGGAASDDAAQLTDVTNQVRRLLAQSGRYEVIDIGSAEAGAVRAHTLHDCGGCDVGTALKAGAAQSLVGVVRRISRTEYTLRFQIRDARTGAIVSKGDSGLRMGANYSWSRGAVRLISDGLLESRSPQ